jgi:DNA (cytosine-5)-methyltransferase 1
MEIIDYHEPSFIILENVRNLLSHDKGRTFEIIKKNLTDRGYLLRYAVLNTAEITGVPQHRERIYIVGIKSREIYDKFSLDFMKIPKEPISKYIMPDVAEKYWYTSKSVIYPLLYKEITKPDTIYQYRRVYIRENKSNECPTLTANMGTGGHNVHICLTVKGIRKLTPRECFSFPETYILPDDIADSKQYCLAGNAVSLIVIKLIANRLIELIV